MNKIKNLKERSDPTKYTEPNYKQYIEDAIETSMSNEYVVNAISYNILSYGAIESLLEEFANIRIQENPDKYAYNDVDGVDHYFTFDDDLLSEDIIYMFTEFMMKKYNIDITGKNEQPQNESYRRRIMKEELDTKKIKGSATAKVRKLQKQYNKILVDLFDQFAAESIEEALEGNEGSFGENINDIVQSALDNLKSKVLEELGITDNKIGTIGITIGGEDMFGLGSELGVSDIASEEGKNTDSDTEENGDSNTENEEDEDEDEDEDNIKENNMNFRDNSTFKKDMIISESRRSDQRYLMDVYSSMHRKMK